MISPVDGILQPLRRVKGLGGLSAAGGTLTSAGEPVELDSILTAAGLFDPLNAGLAIGRRFLTEEERPGHSRFRRHFRHTLAYSLPCGPGEKKEESCMECACQHCGRRLTFPTGNDLGRLAGLGKHIQISRSFNLANLILAPTHRQFGEFSIAPRSVPDEAGQSNRS